MIRLVIIMVCVFPLCGFGSEDSARKLAEGLALMQSQTSVAEVQRGLLLMRAAAEAGEPEACLVLGLTETGTAGVPWLTKAAEAGVVAAQVALAARYVKLMDYPLAYFWYTRAVARGASRDLPDMLWRLMNDRDRVRAWALLRATAVAGGGVPPSPRD